MSEDPIPNDSDRITFSKQKIAPQSYQSSLSLRTSFQPPTRNREETSDELKYEQDEQAAILESDALALNALKKISLGNSTNNTVEQDNIDLSTFASLTRQPRLEPRSDLVETSIFNNLTSVSSGMINTADSAGSDGLTLTPMRRDSNRRAMSQYEGRRPVSPSPILKGELLDLPLKPELMQDDTSISRTEDVEEESFNAKQQTDNLKMDQQQNIRKPEQQFKPATLLTTLSEPAATTAPRPQSQPISATNSDYNMQYTALTSQQQQIPSYYQSTPNVGTRDEERYKDPQSINRLKRPLYVPAVLRPNLTNNYSDLVSSNSSLNSESNDISKDLQRYKEYNSVGFAGTNRGGGSPLAAQPMTMDLSQQSSTSSSPGQQQNIIGKIFDRFLVNKASSQPFQSPQQQLLPSSDASSIFSNASSNYEIGPTRDHWKLDTVLLRCSNCNKVFTNLGKIRRKHHCRSCGDIFCTNCINHYIYLDKDAHFVLIDTQPKNKKQIKDYKLNQPVNKEEKYLSKVCYHCFENYENLLRQSNPSIFHLQVLKKPALASERDEEEEFEEELRNDSIVEVNSGGANGADRGASLPADWNWSSF